MTSIFERAEQSLSKLVEHVFAHPDGTLTPITYEELARRIGRIRVKNGKPHPRGTGKILGQLGHTLQGLGNKWSMRIPEIQSLVVNKNGALKGLPDVGIEEFWPGYPDMSKTAKRDRALAEYREINSFGWRWNKVLEALNLPKIEDSTKIRGGWGGGESIHHLALKEAVHANPEMLGVPMPCRSFIEFALPSLDLIDVLFLSAKACIAVEVKSKISSEDDIVRGIYQTIKYGSILKAMYTANHPDGRPEIQSILLLESSLTPKSRRLAEKLNVRVVENFIILKTT
jgi:hypothetical protein